MSSEYVQPRYPLYIPSKTRWDSRLTIKSLQRMHIDLWYVVVEEQQYKEYANVVDKSHILVLDKKYQDEYETLDDLGYTKSKGPGAARNFAWQHSIDSGYKWHWVMDDNIRHFYYQNRCRKYETRSGKIFWWMEEFCLRYKNIGMAGPSYVMFNPMKGKRPPFTVNTRIYSCNLIRNDVPFRWRGRYNEDTILSLDMITNGWCTVQFAPFQQEKIATQVVKGGNTKEFYEKDGTYNKSKMLVDTYPQYAKMVWRYGRVHHFINYNQFRRYPRLIRDENYQRAAVTNDTDFTKIKVPTCKKK